MNRTLALGIIVTLIAASTVAAGPQRMVFERGSAIWVANIDGSKAEKITEGSGPSLSPDGKKIAFNTDKAVESGRVRELAVVDVATKKVTLVKGIPNKNCQRALWSPDGKQIAFAIYLPGEGWGIGLVSPGGSDFRYLRKPQRSEGIKQTTVKVDPVWSTSWAMDGKSIITQDLSYIYEFKLDGREVKKWKVDSVFPRGAMNSGSRITSSPDGKTLLIEVEMDEEVDDMPDWTGLPPALWTFDLESGKTTRVTERGKLATSGCWRDQTHILFNLYSPSEKQPAIYQMEIGKTEMKQVMKDGANPSVSRAGGNG